MIHEIPHRSIHKLSVHIPTKVALIREFFEPAMLSRQPHCIRLFHAKVIADF